MSAVEIQADEKNVFVLCPMVDMCHTKFAMSLVHMVKNTLIHSDESLVGLQVHGYGTSILPFSRQMLVKTALEQGATHVLFIDSDMEFPQDMLLRFMKHSEPIIGINATARHHPFLNTAQVANGKELHTSLHSSGLEKVERTGFGVVWVALSVFEALDLPWFDFEYLPEQACFRGEDYFFFEKAKKAGYEIYIDHDISKDVRHVGQFGYNPVIKSMQGEMGS